MTNSEELKIIEDMQKVVAQMRIDDIEEDPTTGEELFDCNCCGQNKPLAGSIQYSNYRLCNDCVLIAETGFALKRFNDIHELMKAMEDKRLEELCDFIKKDQTKVNN